jgi:hypothetical protein
LAEFAARPAIDGNRRRWRTADLAGYLAQFVLELGTLLEKRLRRAVLNGQIAQPIGDARQAVGENDVLGQIRGPKN